MFSSRKLEQATFDSVAFRYVAANQHPDHDTIAAAGIIKSVLGFRQFLLRGLCSVQHEWTLVCMGWNLKRLHRLQLASLWRN